MKFTPIPDTQAYLDSVKEKLKDAPFFDAPKFMFRATLNLEGEPPESIYQIENFSSCGCGCLHFVNFRRPADGENGLKVWKRVCLRVEGLVKYSLEEAIFEDGEFWPLVLERRMRIPSQWWPSRPIDYISTGHKTFLV